MISVIVATYERPDALQRCLLHLERCMEGQAGVEVIIVDNSPTGSARCVVARWLEGTTGPFRYVQERTRGHSNARNRGIESARNEVLAFTDDDCEVSKDWLASIRREFSGDPALAMLGGRVELADPLDGKLGLRAFRDRAVIRTVPELFRRMIGCNLACARWVFDRIGLFDPLLGRGSRGGCADDFDLLYRGLLGGLKVVYAPDVLVYHRHGRRASWEICETRNAYARGLGSLHCKYILSGHLGMLKLAAHRLWIEARRWPSGSSDPAAASVLGSYVSGAVSRILRR